MCILFHYWSKWASYYCSVRDSRLLSEFEEYTELREQRRCSKCGTTQDRKVGA